jgi:hypothetical protein
MLTVGGIVKKFTIHFENQCFTVEFTREWYWSLLWNGTGLYCEPDESRPHSHTTSDIRFNIMLLSMPRSPRCPFPSELPTETEYACYMHCSTHIPQADHLNTILRKVQIMKSLTV